MEQLSEHGVILASVGIDAMSWDESDPEQKTEPPSVMRHAPLWRSTDLNEFLEGLDSVSKENRFSKLQVTGCWRGNYKRTRTASCVDERMKAPKGLPINCYNENWYHTLDPYDELQFNSTCDQKLYKFPTFPLKYT